MTARRTNMTVRIVPLGSAEAADGRVAGTADQRLELLRELSERMWALTGRPLPRYTRATMQVKLSTLAEQ